MMFSWLTPDGFEWYKPVNDSAWMLGHVEYDWALKPYMAWYVRVTQTMLDHVDGTQLRDAFEGWFQTLPGWKLSESPLQGDESVVSSSSKGGDAQMGQKVSKTTVQQGKADTNVQGRQDTNEDVGRLLFDHDHKPVTRVTLDFEDGDQKIYTKA